MFDLGININRNPLRRRLPRVIGYYTSVVDCKAPQINKGINLRSAVERG